MSSNYRNFFKRNMLYVYKMYFIFILCLFFSLSCTNDFHENPNIIEQENAFSIFDLYFADSTYKDVTFSKINLPGSIDFIREGKADFDGSILFKKVVDIRDVNSNYILIIEGGIDDYDATYFNDQFIGSSLVYNAPRRYFISKDLIKYGENTIEIKFIDLQGDGGFKGRMYLKSEKGDVISIAGTWDYLIIKDKIESDNMFLVNANIAINPLLWELDIKKDIYISFEFDDYFWKSTDIPIFIEDLQRGQTNIDGVFWFRKKITINNIDKDYSINIPKGIDDSDQIYFNGILVGSTSCYDCPRDYLVKKELLRKGDNIIAILLSDVSETGGISSEIFLNSGLDSTSISKDWKYKQLYFSQIVSIFKEAKENVFNENEFLYFSVHGDKLKPDDIISKSIISEKFPLTNYFLIFLLLIVLVLGAINFNLLKKRRKESTSKGAEEKLSNNYIFIRSDRLNVKLLVVDIIYIIAIKDYVKVVTLKKNYLVRKNLKTFSVDLSDDDFIRISRSIVVNVTKITLIDRNMVYLSDSSFKIGGMYTEAVNKLMHK